MNTAQTNHGGWLESLRRIGGSLFALLGSRFELFTVELHEERLRLLNLLVWLGLAAAIGAAGISVATIALALWLWAAAGYAGLIGLAAAAMVVAAIIVAKIRHRMLTSPTPFAQTVAEFRKDGECLRSDK